MFKSLCPFWNIDGKKFSVEVSFLKGRKKKSVISRLLFCRGRLRNVRVSQLFCLLNILFLLLSRRRRGFFFQVPIVFGTRSLSIMLRKFCTGLRTGDFAGHSFFPVKLGKFLWFHVSLNLQMAFRLSILVHLPLIAPVSELSCRHECTVPSNERSRLKILRRLLGWSLQPGRIQRQ